MLGTVVTNINPNFPEYIDRLWTRLRWLRTGRRDGNRGWCERSSEPFGKLATGRVGDTKEENMTRLEGPQNSRLNQPSGRSTTARIKAT